MNTSELRLGNLVNEEVLGWVKVSAILSNTVVVLAKVLVETGAIVDREYSMHISNIKPISLTIELLQKVGFKSAYSSFHDNVHILNLKKDGFELQYHSGVQDGILVSPPQCEDAQVVHCPYLHQLQNLYYVLQGSELPINL